MKKIITLTLALAAVSMSLVAATAGTMKPMAKPMAKPKAAKAVTCPSCKMPMGAKSASMNIPVYLAKSKRTVYCCAMCPSGKTAAAYWKKNHKAMSVPM